MTQDLNDYAFDCKLWAIVRLKATSEEAAREIVTEVLDSLDLSDAFIDGYNSKLEGGLKITEASVATGDREEIVCFEVNEEALY